MLPVQTDPVVSPPPRRKTWVTERATASYRKTVLLDDRISAYPPPGCHAAATGAASVPGRTAVYS